MKLFLAILSPNYSRVTTKVQYTMKMPLWNCFSTSHRWSYCRGRSLSATFFHSQVIWHLDIPACAVGFPRIVPSFPRVFLLQNIRFQHFGLENQAQRVRLSAFRLQSVNVILSNFLQIRRQNIEMDTNQLHAIAGLQRAPPFTSSCGDSVDGRNPAPPWILETL